MARINANRKLVYNDMRVYTLTFYFRTPHPVPNHHYYYSSNIGNINKSRVNIDIIVPNLK